MLRGPTKVDLIFVHETFEARPPWEPSSATLPQIDAHFWDWILWLAQKRARGNDELVQAELAKMHAYLLAPIAVPRTPATIEAATADYREARTKLESMYGVTLPRALENEVAKALRL